VAGRVREGAKHEREGREEERTSIPRAARYIAILCDNGDMHLNFGGHQPCLWNGWS